MQVLIFMFAQTHFKKLLLVASSLCFCLNSFSQEKPCLADYLDSFYLTSFHAPPISFTLTEQNIIRIFTEHAAGSEFPERVNPVIWNDIRSLSMVYRDDLRPIQIDGPISLRHFLEKFCTVWDVEVVLFGSTLLIVEQGESAKWLTKPVVISKGTKNNTPDKK